jgi:hypothetical protein
MATPANPPGNPNPAPATNGQTELLRFLREEADKNRESLRDESLAVRELFVKTSGIVAIPLTAAIVLAGIFFYHSLDEMKKSMIDEAQTETKLEIKKMDGQIDDTLQQQFTTKSMQDRIDRAAETATEGKAKTLIEDRVRAITEPLQQQAQIQLASIHIQELIARVNADDAKAFDELLQLRDKGDTAQQALIQRVVADKIRNDFLLNLSAASTPTNCELSSGPFRNALASSDAWIRKGAIEKCLSAEIVAQWLRGEQQPFEHLTQIPPILVNIAQNDSSLVARHQAIENFNDLFHYSPGYPSNGLDLLDTRQLSNWWEENKSHNKELLLLSIAATPQYLGLNTIRLYDEVDEIANVAPPFLQDNFKSALERMRSGAIQHNSDSVAALTNNMKRGPTLSCDEVERDFSLRLDQEWKMELELKQTSIPDYGLWELEFVKTCPSNAAILKKISVVMAQTRLLDRRYGATMLVNKWTGSTLDPFNTKAIHEWWDHNKATLGN